MTEKNRPAGIKNRRLHIAFYSVVSFILAPFVKAIFHLDMEKVRPKNRPALVLCNHTTNLDPLFIGIAFPQMYFVAGEQLFRMGWISGLLKFFLRPIMRLKSRTEMHTSMEILRTLRAGGSVCIFAEGSCSWDGVSGVIPPATAKLAKRSGASLITYRTEGGYLLHPRWAKYRRGGKMYGRLVKEYSPAELEAFSSDELYSRIRSDLWVDAYEANKKPHIPYPGRNKAESIETALFLCPKCGRLGTIHSSGDGFSCGCGLSMLYDDYGMLKNADGGEPPFSTMTQWSRWQEGWITERREELLSAPADKPIIWNDGQRLYHFQLGSKTRLMAEGRMTLFNDRLTFSDEKTRRLLSFPLSEITDMAVITSTHMPFTVGGEYYEVKSDIKRSALMYVRLCSALSDMRVMV